MTAIPKSASFSVRAARPGDQPVLESHAEDIQRHDGDATATPALVAQLFAERGVDLDADSLVVVGPDDHPVGATFVVDAGRAVSEPERVFLLPGGVAPAFRGRGAGRLLLEWACRRATVRAAAGETSGLVAVARVDCREDLSDRTRLYARKGFQPVRWFAQLEHDLIPPLPEFPLPDGLGVEPWSEALNARVMRVSVEAFDSHWASQAFTAEGWRTNVIGRAGFRPDLSVVALAGDEVAGFCMASEERAADGHGAMRGHIIQLGVQPRWRSQRLGSALMRVALERFREASLASARLSVDVDNPTRVLALCEKLGYRESVRFARFSKTLVPGCPS